MKSYLIIGLGRFGSSLAQELCRLGNEVLAVDTDQNNVHALADQVTHAVIADARDSAVLESLSARDFDCAVVSVGNDVGSSALITLSLKEMGIPKVICKAQSHDHRKVLEKIGADQVVFPEHETGVKLAQNLTHSNVLNFIELSEDYGIVEAKAPASWIGKTIKEMDVRNKFHVNIIAIRAGETENINIAPGADYILKESDVLILLGQDQYTNAVHDL